VVARCLGAKFSLFGRPTLFGAAAAGAAGIERVIHIVRSEVDMVLAQIGCKAYDELHPGFLWGPQKAPAAASAEVQHVKQPEAVPFA